MRAIFCDIDGTLTVENKKWADPNYETINKIKSLIENGRPVVVWSARGGRYAKKFCEKYDIKATLTLSKPAMFVDDNPTLRPKKRMPTLSPEEFLDWEFDELKEGK
jgi:hydroxymethylpyrimidine pyrophosphatase-like HAD family hydrolase